MPALNDAQFGLFPADHPAMRERTTAEMSSEQFRTLPGAYHHATYRATMPEKSTGSGSAGIHLGTLKAARERVDDMGARNPQMSDIHADPSKPADVHVRRIAPEVERHPEGADPRIAPSVDKTGMWMKGSHSHPTDDRGEDWSGEHYGEFYKNTHEDAGSISVRVPNGAYLDTHRKAVDRATRLGDPVHPEAAAAAAGGHLDKPEQYTAGSRPDATTPYARYQARSDFEPSASDNREQGMLLPHKLQATYHGPRESVPEPHREHGKDSHATQRSRAVTFAATPEDRDALLAKKYKTVMGDGAPKWESKTGKF